MSDSQIIPGGHPNPGFGGEPPPYSVLFPLEFRNSITEIFARTTGSDKHGDGKSQATAYRTFQRAIRDVPMLPPPGARYIVDITDLGIESLPLNYALPVIDCANYRFPNAGPAYNSADPTGRPWFLLSQAVIVRADPKLATSTNFGPLPPTEAIITATQATSLTAVASSPNTMLVTLTIDNPRGSWTPGALRGKQLIRTVTAFPYSDTQTPGGFTGTASCAIYDNNATQLLLTIDSGAFNNGDGALFMATGEELRIVEPSATLLGQPSPTDSFGDFPAQVFDVFLDLTPATTCRGISGIGFQGVALLCTVPGSVPSLLLAADSGSLELCVVDSLLIEKSLDPTFLIGGNVITHALDLEFGTNVTIFSSLIMDCNGFGFIFVGGSGLATANVVFDSCKTIGSGLTENNSTRWSFVNTKIQNVTGAPGSPAVAAFDPSGYNFNNVEINNPLGDGILVDGTAEVILNNVNGSSAGYGLHVVNGNVQVRDNLTLITGNLGDMKCGSLPIRGGSVVAGDGWKDFRTQQPVNNEYDLQMPFIQNLISGLFTPAGEETTGPGTGGSSGSRIFQLAPLF